MLRRAGWQIAMGVCLCAFYSGCGGEKSLQVLVLGTKMPDPELLGTGDGGVPPDPDATSCKEGAGNKPDGMACSSGDPTAKCYKGECVSIDWQCAKLWSDYKGQWVGGGRNGAPGQCDTSGCILNCTNTEWQDYCKTYDCPAGYKCTVGSMSVTGPASVDYCSCMQVQQSSTVYLQDGTPCGPPDKICLNHQCVARPLSTP